MVYQARTVSSSSSSPRAAHKASTSHRAPKRGQNAPKGPKKRTNRKKGLWWKILLGVLGGLLAIGIGLFTYLYVTTDIPQPEKVAIAEKTTVYYNDGTTEIGSFSEQNREIIDCSVLPDYVGNAIVASEDRSFYRNGGIDIMGMARALYNNLTTGSRQGGSTITQQYAERYYLGDTTSYSGKIREAILAMKIANSQDKQQVLCNYMNTIYLGRGAYGIQAAAKAYFGKEAKDLTVDEAAMIAGIIPAPSMWDPAVNPEQAKSRFTRVIGIMREDGYITGQQASEAKFPETKPVSVSNDLAGPNGYLLTTVENELVASKAFTKDELETGGYKIVSTLDPNMQKIMQTVGDDRPEGMPESIQVGGIALDQKTGSVKAIYGGSDYLKHQLNNATQANFQPGSTMKPFGLLGAAMDDVNFNTMFNGNSPERFETTPGTWAEVPNALNMSWGTINLKQATANSVNTVFMNVNQHLTPKKFAQIAHDAGITGDIQEDTLYNILGINSLTVWDLAQGHSTIANDGTKNTLHIVDRVLKGDKEMYKPNLGTKQVFDANDCMLVQNAMLGTTQYGTAAGTAATLGRQVAGKSGTANDETAASFVGYTPSLMNVWAIWNPGENGESQIVPEFAGYGVSSTGYPSHLFTEFMAQALAGQPAETFATPVDNGKIGGPNGDWGLGGQRYVPSTNNGTQQRQQNEQQQDSQNKQESNDSNTSNESSNNGDAKQNEQQQTTPENTKSPEQSQPENGNTNGDSGGGTGGNNGSNNGSNNNGSNSGDSGNSGNQNGNGGGNSGGQNNTGNGEQSQR
ncbi:transglycosylase domain-containing protein [Bifidobacterium animalis]|uniref:transglycosylase domain-containing protein n=1 Tax=Bifidobacterium animalis TaxID=28025 RepID=UPI00080C4DF3|nr:transglycosylase domain-containing protein [Bifidobacterium animalis]ANU43515.1 penicillin-binding protein [Bifidobacterium animalis subsp. animalis]PHQ54120.1 penicillin-binding protein [Bifidobacterium animalis subsp. animalis]QQQ89739.1 penicillin-binding protein [Bifidobacterium animalis]UQE63815.1 penicillin-binding protein [Bifidobacterium animalis]